jgi:hypothetical protein
MDYSHSIHLTVARFLLFFHLDDKYIRAIVVFFEPEFQTTFHDEFKTEILIEQ